MMYDYGLDHGELGKYFFVLTHTHTKAIHFKGQNGGFEVVYFVVWVIFLGVKPYFFTCDLSSNTPWLVQLGNLSLHKVTHWYNKHVTEN